MNKNDPFSRFSHFLGLVMGRPHLHAKWLNTLSMMEFVGAQKIMKSAHPLKVDEFLLKHGAEEIRHAAFFKRHATNMGRKVGYVPTYSPQDLFSPWKSLHYIPKLEVFLSRLVKGLAKNDGHDLFKKRVYLLTTYGIEIRAMRIYPLYEERLNAHTLDFSLKGLIFEEQGHLQDMEDSLNELLNPDEREFVLNELRTFEERLFCEWIDSLARGMSDAYEKEPEETTRQDQAECLSV